MFVVVLFVVRNGEISARIELPIAGLISY